jgi:hypothetical protein
MMGRPGFKFELTAAAAAANRPFQKPEPIENDVLSAK